MFLTPSKLREDIYNILDHVIETGEPVIIDRKGSQVTLLPKKKDPLEVLFPKKDLVVGDSDDLVHMEWSLDEWEKKWNKQLKKAGKTRK